MIRSIKSRLLGAFALVAVCLAPLADAATTQTPVALPSTAFVDLGTGPIYLSAGGNGIVYQVVDSQPTAGAGGFIAQPSDPPVPISSTSHVWARALSSQGATAWVAAGTGITLGSSGGGGSVTQGTSPWVTSVTGTLPGSVGAAAIATGQWSNATGSATLIVAARTGAAGTGRVSVTLYNSGSTTLFYGVSGVTTSTGTRLLAGGSRTIYTTAAIYGVPASGTSTLDYDEVF